MPVKCGCPTLFSEMRKLVLSTTFWLQTCISESFLTEMFCTGYGENPLICKLITHASLSWYPSPVPAPCTWRSSPSTSKPAHWILQAVSHFNHKFSFQKLGYLSLRCVSLGNQSTKVYLINIFTYPSALVLLICLLSLTWWAYLPTRVEFHFYVRHTV